MSMIETNEGKTVSLSEEIKRLNMNQMKILEMKFIRQQIYQQWNVEDSKKKQ